MSYPPEGWVVVVEGPHGDHLVDDLQPLPPAPLLLGAAEPVEGQLGHQLPRRHAGKVGRGLQHLAAVYGHIRSDSISRLLQTCREFHHQTS